MYKPIYEFLVWDNCNNNCAFCFQREEPRLFTPLKRSQILDETISFIEDTSRFTPGSHILICGGEIFDKPVDFNVLSIFFQKIIDKMNIGHIDLLYINTNLIYTDLTGVKTLLALINENDLFERLKFTTSYDLEGRFLIKNSQSLMLNNLKWINTNFPACKIVTNTILTKPTCEAILNETFSVKTFMQEYKCRINLIPYIVLDSELTAPRNLIFKALKHVDSELPGYLAEYVPNMSITQEKWLYMYKNNKFTFCSCALSECGHSVNFKRYSNAGTCFCCDILEIFGDTV